jgi:sporulation protein YlmC with PRC-barrel domain
MKIGNQVSVFALALALSAAVPAFAQDATDTTTAPDPTLTDPAATDPAMTDPAADAAADADAAAAAEPVEEGSAVTVVDVEAGAPEGLLADTEFSPLSANDLIGKSVVNAEGETIGEIDDLVFDNSNTAMFAVVQVGGFLGIGSKAVAIPFAQLQISEDQATMMSSVTEDELTEMAAYADDDYDPAADATDDVAEDLSDAGDAVVDAGEDVADAGADAVDAGEDLIDDDTTTSPDLAATTDADLAPAESEMTTDTTATADADMTAEQTETGELQAGADIDAGTVDEQEPASGEMSSADEASMVARESPFADMTAGELIGKDVVNTAGETIGEITDLVISDEKAVHALISVGGFLGIGDKDVAVPLDDLQVGEDEAVLTSGLTKEALEQLPDYEDETWPALEGDQPIYTQ